MSEIAIVTGATGGLGQAFVKRLVKEDLGEIWAVARNGRKRRLKGSTAQGSAP